MWIARDEDNDLYLYEREPIREIDYFYSSYVSIKIDNNLFSEVTFENSPKQVELKLIEENVAVAESPLKTFPRVNEFETGASYRH